MNTESTKIENRLLEKVNEDKVTQYKNAQIELCGSEYVYRTVHRNLLILQIDPLLIKQHFDLYEWRTHFFRESFGEWPSGNWFTDGEDQAHRYDCIPYQVTQNFDKVLCLACADGVKRERIYFESNMELSHKINRRFERKTMQYFIQRPVLHIFQNWTVSEIAHVLIEMSSVQPKSLLNIAVDAVRKQNLPLDMLPSDHHGKVIMGTHASFDDIGENVNENAKTLIKSLDLKDLPKFDEDVSKKRKFYCSETDGDVSQTDLDYFVDIDRNLHTNFKICKESYSSTSERDSNDDSDWCTVSDSDVADDGANEVICANDNFVFCRSTHYSDTDSSDYD